MKYVRILYAVSDGVNRGLLGIGAVFLIAMMVLTCGNIFFRWAWLPIRGTYELMGLFGAVVISFALANTQTRRGHIAVEVLIHRFPKSVQQVLGAVSSMGGFLFFSLLARQTFKLAAILRESGELTESLEIVYYPFTYAAVLGCGVSAQ